MCRGAEVGVKLHDLDSTQSQLKVLRHSVIGIEGDRIFKYKKRKERRFAIWFDSVGNSGDGRAGNIDGKNDTKHVNDFYNG